MYFAILEGIKHFSFKLFAQYDVEILMCSKDFVTVPQKYKQILCNYLTFWKRNVKMMSLHKDLLNMEKKFKSHNVFAFKFIKPEEMITEHNVL